MASMAYIDRVRNHFSPFSHGMGMQQFLEILQDYEKRPKPLREVRAQISKLFNGDAKLLQDFEGFLHETYPEQHAEVVAFQIARNDVHRLACERQTESALLKLPRELRDKIWQEGLSGNVIHVSTKQFSTKNRESAFGSRKPKKGNKFQYHACRATNQSSACPLGIGDHANCSTGGPPDHVPSISLVCKQISLELPNIEYSFFSWNAFQFADLRVAESFLFSLTEPQRELITHLKLAVPYHIATQRQGSLQFEYLAAWESITNYFNNPWDRRSLHMYPEKGDSKQLLKLPTYFYYSGCYFEKNKHRLHKRWQVGRGDTSWDIGISDLIYKGEPKLDLAMEIPEDVTSGYCSNEQPEWNLDFDYPSGWLKSLLQFKQYDELRFQIYDKQGLISNPKFEEFKSALKKYMVGPEIGPRKCVFFMGRPRERAANTSYVDCVRY